MTVTGVDDSIADGNQPYTIVDSPAGQRPTPATTGSTAADVSVTNIDNDTAGITVTPTSGLTTTEAGGTATFTVVLNSQPDRRRDDRAVAASDTTEGTVSTAPARPSRAATGTRRRP